MNPVNNEYAKEYAKEAMLRIRDRYCSCARCLQSKQEDKLHSVLNILSSDFASDLCNPKKEFKWKI